MSLLLTLQEKEVWNNRVQQSQISLQELIEGASTGASESTQLATNKRVSKSPKPAPQVAFTIIFI